MTRSDYDFINLSLGHELNEWLSERGYARKTDNRDRPVIGAVQNDGYRIDNQAFQADSVEAFRKQ